MKTPLWMAIWVLVLELVVILILIPGNWTDQAIIKETSYVEQSHGKETAEWAKKQAQTWFQSSIIDSGLYAATHHFMFPTEQERLNSAGLENFGEHIFIWAEGRLDALTAVIFHFYLRFAVVMLWAPYMLILLLPAVYDGVLTRKIKQTDFAYASPTLHRYSIRLLCGLVIGMFIAFFMPVAMNPMLIPIILMMCCVFMGIAWGNFQKRI